MKRMLIIMVIAIAASSIALGQTKMSKDDTVEAQVIALEKASWEAWKNKDSKWFQAHLTEDVLHVNSGGVTNKAQIIKSVATDCEVKSYSQDNFKFVMLDKNSALITFTGTQDGVCGGNALPSTVRASAVYVKRGRKWLNAFYMKTLADQ